MRFFQLIRHRLWFYKIRTRQGRLPYKKYHTRCLKLISNVGFPGNSNFEIPMESDQTIYFIGFRMVDLVGNRFLIIKILKHKKGIANLNSGIEPNHKPRLTVWVLFSYKMEKYSKAYIRSHPITYKLYFLILRTIEFVHESKIINLQLTIIHIWNFSKFMIQIFQKSCIRNFPRISQYDSTKTRYVI